MTREEAINKLVNARYADEFQGDEELTTAHLMAIKALKQTRWIPVSERLPENSGSYLITYCLRDEIETQEAVYVKDEEDDDKWFDITDVEITLAVIAWMPLPKPYEAEGSGKE